MMKKLFPNFLLIGLISLGLFTAVSAQAKKTAEEPVEPTAKEAIKLILSNGDISLASNSSCKSVGTSPKDTTILDYLSGVLSFQAMPDSENKIGFAFTRENGKNQEIVWVCDLMFYGKDTEDVWSNGVRFKMLNSDRKLLRDSVKCIGAG
jgi:hypothetical protein